VQIRLGELFHESGMSLHPERALPVLDEHSLLRSKVMETTLMAMEEG
jgi:hypothetical protein